MLVVQKIAEDVDRAGYRGGLEAPRSPIATTEFFASH